MKINSALIFILCCFTLKAQQQQFVVDRTFGESCGISQVFLNEAEQYELFKLSSGKYMIIGERFGLESAESNEIIFARYNTNGTIDTGFAAKGMKLFNFDVFTKVTSAAYFNNKIYIAGFQAPDNAFSNFRASISRFNEDGTPDSTFNGTGTLVEPVFSASISSSFYTHLLVQPDGRIVCFGFESKNSKGGLSIAIGKRYYPNGTVDTTFNNSPGYGYPSFNNGSALYNSPGVLESDGAMRFVYPALNGPSTLVSVKIDSTGAPVESYGKNGSKSTGIGLYANRIHRFLASGDTIYGLHYKQNADDDMRAYSLDANGNLNTDFSDDGILDLPNYPATGGFERPFAMHLDSQNKLYFFGSASFNQDKCAFYRTDLLGNLDTTLAGTGSFGLSEFPFSAFRNVYFEDDTTIIANIYTNNRISLIKLRLKTSNISISTFGNDTICSGSSTSLSIINPSACYTYSWTKDSVNFAGNDSVILVTQAGVYQATAIASNETSFSQGLEIVVIVCTGINEVNESKYAIYPNPAGSFLNVKMQEKHFNSYIITDISGWMIQNEKSPNQNTIDISKLVPGIYFIQLIDDISVTQLKFIKE